MSIPTLLWICICPAIPYLILGQNSYRLALVSSSVQHYFMRCSFSICFGGLSFHELYFTCVESTNFRSEVWWVLTEAFGSKATTTIIAWNISFTPQSSLVPLCGQSPHSWLSLLATSGLVSVIMALHRVFLKYYVEVLGSKLLGLELTAWSMFQ
jgi:hypothetical protein